MMMVKRLLRRTMVLKKMEKPPLLSLVVDGEEGKLFGRNGCKEIDVDLQRIIGGIPYTKPSYRYLNFANLLLALSA